METSYSSSTCSPTPRTSERVEAVLPGPDLAVRTRAAFAWQDEVLREVS